MNQSLILNGSQETLYSITFTTSPNTTSSGPMTGISDILKTLAFLLIVACLLVSTLVGNILVACAVFSVRKLRQPANYLLVSLGVADFFVGLMVMPFAAMYHIHAAWPLGRLACIVWTTADVFLCSASILNLCAISVDRYWVITKPLIYVPQRTTKRILTYVGIVWACALVISVLPVLTFSTPQMQGVCTVNQTLAYQLYATMGAFYIPVLIMLIVNAKIFIAARRLQRVDACAMSAPMPSSAPATPSNSVKISEKIDKFRRDIVFTSKPNGTNDITGTTESSRPFLVSNDPKPVLLPVIKIPSAVDQPGPRVRFISESATDTEPITAVTVVNDDITELSQIDGNNIIGNNTDGLTGAEIAQNRTLNTDISKEITDSDRVQFQGQNLVDKKLNLTNCRQQRSKKLRTRLKIWSKSTVDSDSNAPTEKNGYVKVHQKPKKCRCSTRSFPQQILSLRSPSFSHWRKIFKRHNNPDSLATTDLSETGLEFGNIQGTNDKKLYSRNCNSQHFDSSDAMPTTIITNIDNKTNNDNNVCSDSNKNHGKLYSRINSNKSSSSSGSNSNSGFQGGTTFVSSESKAARTLSVIIGAFITCWLPFFIIALVKPFLCPTVTSDVGDNGQRLACGIPSWLDGLTTWLGYSNSALNPMLYAAFNRDFRIPFREILCFRCRTLKQTIRMESYEEQYGIRPERARRHKN